MPHQDSLLDSICIWFNFIYRLSHSAQLWAAFFSFTLCPGPALTEVLGTNKRPKRLPLSVTMAFNEEMAYASHMCNSWSMVIPAGPPLGAWQLLSGLGLVFHDEYVVSTISIPLPPPQKKIGWTHRSTPVQSVCSMLILPKPHKYLCLVFCSLLCFVLFNHFEIIQILYILY